MPNTKRPTFSRKPLRHLAAVAAGCLPLSAAYASTSQASAEIIERVVATVNDDAIFLSELRRRAAPFLERVVTGASESERPAAHQALVRAVSCASLSTTS